MVLKHKGQAPKVGTNLHRLEQSYLNDLVNQRNNSQSQLNQYENYLNVELNDQYTAHGLRIHNQVSGQQSALP